MLELDKQYPQYQLAKKQMTGLAGMLCFGLCQAAPGARARFLRQLKHIAYALSLGDTGSLLIWNEGEQARQYGYPPEFHQGFFRMSVGLEAAEDLTAELGRALEAV